MKLWKRQAIDRKRHACPQYIGGFYRRFVHVLRRCAPLTTKRMAIEFERYGFSDKRVFIAMSQILGALGLLMGLIMPIVGIIASAGFTVQMVCALVVRL